MVAATTAPEPGRFFDDEGLAEALLQLLPDQTREQVGAAARRVGHHQGDGAARIGLAVAPAIGEPTEAREPPPAAPLVTMYARVVPLLEMTFQIVILPAYAEHDLPEIGVHFSESCSDFCAMQARFGGRCKAASAIRPPSRADCLTPP